VRRAAAVLLALAALLALSACGSREVIRQPTVLIPNSRPAEPEARGVRNAGVRIAVVTHGQASSPFWAIVRNGVEAAGRQVDVLISYRAPETYSVQRMRGLIDEAVASRPDGLVVSIPEPAVEPAIRRAVKAGIPVVSINSGAGAAKRLGVLAHVGQPEGEAGYEAGRRLARSGARRVLCVNHQVGNVGLDARCRGLARALHRAGGATRTIAVSDQDPTAPRLIAAAIASYRADAVLTLNATAASAAVAAVRSAGRAGRTRVATFDLGPDVLRAVRAGRIAFAVDQQAYLQGYLPVILLAQRARYGLFPARRGGLIPTGPNFVTRADAGRVIALSRRSIR
jgi:simple sugar transport system substrate-binding protein